MKGILVFICAVSLFFGSLVFAQDTIETPIVKAGNTSTWTHVQVEGDKISSFVAKTRGEQDWLIAATRSPGDNYFTVPGESSFSMDLKVGSGSTIFCFKCVSSGCTVEVIVER